VAAKASDTPPEPTPARWLDGVLDDLHGIPIFPELRPHLEECFERAEPGTIHVINRYRDSNANLRSQLGRIFRRAGLKTRPRLFQNLRAPRETELTAKHPLHVVCEWIGNSALVASARCLQVTEADFARASFAGPTGGAISGAVVGDLVQNPVQHAAEGSRISSPENEKPQCFLGFFEILRQILRKPTYYSQGDSNRMTQAP
jgi:hypothetical protein